MSSRRVILVVVVAALAGALWWAFGRPAAPATVPTPPAAPPAVVAPADAGPTGAGSTSDPLPKPPAPSVPSTDGGPRIVSLSPGLTVMLQHLGLGPRIVGKHGFDLAADPSAIVCGDQGGIDYEALLRVRPTHILIQKGAEELPERLKTLANENGWQVFVYPLLTLSEIQAAAVSLHTLFPPTPSTLPEGAPTPESEQRREILLAFDHLLDRYTGRFSGAGRILLLESIAPPAGPGPGSFHQQILERLGGTPAITTGKPYITMDAEDVLRLAPDGIIIFAPRKPGTPAEDPGPEELLTRLGRLGTLDIPAVKNRRIALIDEPFALTPSTALIEVGQRIEQILTRWQSR